MKIINTKSGKAYQLVPETQLEIEKTNPFFNDYGEQSLPVSLPDSPYNRDILNFPNVIQRKEKIQLLDASIQDGEYFVPCRQAILSVSPSESIETSFYINEGSFYSKLENTYITDVFADETVDGINTLDQAISYLKQLNTSGGDEMFSIFRVKINDDDNDNPRYLNGNDGRSSLFYNENDTTEYIDGKTISVTRGFYMTPFIKANYVLKRLFAHFGYTLLDNFFTKTSPFPDMVFINNVADAIVTGKIRIDQLVPKVTCSKILDLFRRKFCCEFITDEVNRTVDVIMFNDLMSDKADVNLSSSLVGKLRVEYPDKYKQLILEAKDSVDGTIETFDSLELIKSKYPTAIFNERQGYFVRNGFKISTRLSSMITPTTEIVADCGQRYYEGGEFETYKIEVPECIPSAGMYIGEVQYLNSSMKITGTDTANEPSETETNASSNMYVMLAFAHKEADWKFTEGSVSNYIYRRSGRNEINYKFSDFALVYNGPYGIFEKFYKEYDKLLRNSMHTVKADLLLTQHQKMTLSSFKKLVIHGAELLPNKINYNLGLRNDPIESELYTTQLYEPVSFPKSIEEIFPSMDTGYKWVGKTSYKLISEDEYNSSPFKDAEISPFFPPPPTADLVGKKMYVCYTAGIYISQNWALYTFWLEAVPDADN